MTAKERKLYEAANAYAWDIDTGDLNTNRDIFIAGAEWQKEQFEKERLKHCDELTPQEAQIESDFVTEHLKNNNRTPTFIDAIEYGKRLMIDRADKLEELGQAMYDKMQNLTTDCTGIRAAMKKWWCYINKLNMED